jgi:hypothetical protein
VIGTRFSRAERRSGGRITQRLAWRWAPSERALRAANVAGGLALFLGMFWVYGDRPLVGEVWQWADDGLYLRQAEGILRWIHGAGQQWLGPYDAVLLSKTPFFAVWMAALHVLNIPIRLAEFGVLLSLPWLFRSAVRPITLLSRWQFTVCVLLLTALPFLPFEQRLLRVALQAGLVSGCLIAALGVILRVRNDNHGIAGWASLVGLFFSLSYLNREDAIWLFPAVAATASALLAGAWWARSWRRALQAFGCLVAALLIPILTIAALNYDSYGVFFTTVRRAPGFTSAYQMMTRLEPSSRERFVPISAATRQKAYAVSPTFARLQPFLEGPPGDQIATHPSHLFMNDRSPDTREFFVSNFEFVLRDAAFHVGARSARDSEVLFTTIARELEDAVAMGRINAGNRGPALLAAPLPDDYTRIAAQAVVSARKLYTLDRMVYPAIALSSGSAEELQRLENLTQTASAPTSELKPLDLPDIGGTARRAVYNVLTKFQMVAYWIGTLALLVFIARTTRHRQLERSFAGIVLSGSIFAFCLSIGVADVLGFPLLRWAIAYNTVGYAPLSVACAFGLVLLVCGIAEKRQSKSLPVPPIR